jgi:hypothetical protein
MFLGDVVAVLDGEKVPLVLKERPLPDGDTGGDGDVKYEVVGTAYVHAFMDGLAAAWVETGMLQRRDFHVI